MDPLLFGSAFSDFSALTEMLDMFAQAGKLVALIVALAASGTFILRILSKWNIFVKAGENGWAALIPFYSRYVYYSLTWGNGVLFLLSYIPGVSYAMNIATKVKLSCAFDKNGVFAVGLVFCEPVFLAILAFDESEYVF